MTNDRCLVDLAPITVRTHELTVGDTVTFEASLGPRDCLPSDIVTADWRWSSGDTLIALIDPLSGFTQGISPGDVTIEVRHAQNRFVSSGTGLQVVAKTGH